jgi:8-amino-7-oxononanoate synthase
MELEQRIARFKHAEACVVFQSGFAANAGTVSAILGPDDHIISDELNHASIIDGCRLSGARIARYRHSDAADLRRVIGETSGYRRGMIISDGVFSMDGDLAPLAELLDLAERHDALLVVDEAHATGVLGDRGRGLTDLLPAGRGYDPERLLKVGTLSKALASQGGFVCSSRRVIDWLVNRARPYIFSTALAPPCAAAARRAVRAVVEEPRSRDRLLALAGRLCAKLQQAGYAVPRSRCQIVPLIVGEPGRAVALSARLRERGLLVPAIRPPAVPPGTARLRISLTAGHTEEDVGRLLDALRQE